MASSVDLPDPEAPTIATASPEVTSRSMSCRITRSLIPLLTVFPMPRAESTVCPPDLDDDSAEACAPAGLSAFGSTLRRFILSFGILVTALSTALAPLEGKAASRTILVYGDSL